MQRKVGCLRILFLIVIFILKHLSSQVSLFENAVQSEPYSRNEDSSWKPEGLICHCHAYDLPSPLVFGASVELN